jgi:hypothetical protein
LRGMRAKLLSRSSGWDAILRRGRVASRTT